VNFIENETPQKLRGGYYTAPDIASFLSRWVLGTNPTDVLEPSSGDGAFVRALAQLDLDTLSSIVACELDQEEARKTEDAARALPASTRAEVWAGDFLTWALERLERPGCFDGVVGNPPFIRYQYLDARLQDRAERIIRHFNLRFTKHTNAWVPFVVASLAMLRPGGRLGMVVPAELLHVLHSQSIRDFLIEQCSRVLVLDPEEIWFEDTLQGVVLLLAEKKPLSGPGSRRPADVAIRPVTGREFLSQDPDDLMAEADFTSGSILPGKWMVALLNARERSLLKDLAEDARVRRFDDIASVAVGIVTGANKFFLVPDKTVDAYSLEQFALPMFGRSEHVPGVIYDEAVHRSNRSAGLPANFIYFNGTVRSALPAGALRYIEMGEEEGLHRRYKCRIREPWFTVPSAFTSSIGMLKRSHDYPRLVLNTAGAYTTDTAYRIEPKTLTAPHLVWAFVNSLTALTAELEGRHYGGGVLELVPSEIKKLLVPLPAFEGPELLRLEQACRAGTSPGELFALQNPHVLGGIGLSAHEIDSLAHAWLMLRNRRQRTGGAEGPQPGSTPPEATAFVP